MSAGVIEPALHAPLNFACALPSEKNRKEAPMLAEQNGVVASGKPSEDREVDLESVGRAPLLGCADHLRRGLTQLTIDTATARFHG